MPDVVVTVPQRLWLEWLGEGDLPGEEWAGETYAYYGGGPAPDIASGERVYIVAHGRLRGYAPLVALRHDIGWDGRPNTGGWALIRGGGAVAVTIPEAIRGFRGWRYRWWDRDQEQPFPEWQTADVPALNHGQGTG